MICRWAEYVHMQEKAVRVASTRVGCGQKARRVSVTAQGGMKTGHGRAGTGDVKEDKGDKNVVGVEIKKGKTFGTRDSRAIPHLSTNLARRNLISECGMGSDACCRGMAECACNACACRTYSRYIPHSISFFRHCAATLLTPSHPCTLVP